MSAAQSRRIGAYDSGRRGPLLLVTAAVHGNEPAGVEALRRVFDALERLQPRIQGRIVGLIGNRSALERGVRFIDIDLNRLWSARAVRALLAADPAADNSEQREQRELLAEMERELAQPASEVLHLDLHSTSGGGPPFTVLDGRIANQRVAQCLPVPAILGLLKNVEGTVLDFAAAREFPCLVLEGGQNEAPQTVDHHEAALWLLMQSMGMFEELEGVDLKAMRERLERSVQGLPPAVEICLRYHIADGERFTMLPGFESFQAVRQGQLLALGGKSGMREIRCPLGSILLMPRYQGQGADGFFLARIVDLVA
jgi:succinylglutamate desuccinylase